MDRPAEITPAATFRAVVRVRIYEAEVLLNVDDGQGTVLKAMLALQNGAKQTASEYGRAAGELLTRGACSWGG